MAVDMLTLWNSVHLSVCPTFPHCSTTLLSTKSYGKGAPQKNNTHISSLVSKFLTLYWSALHTFEDSGHIFSN